MAIDGCLELWAVLSGIVWEAWGVLTAEMAETEI